MTLTKVQKVAAWITAFTIIGGGLTATVNALGIRPLTVSEAIPLFVDLLDRKRLELENLKILVYMAKKKGDDIPPELLRKIIRLEREIKKLEKN